MPYPRLPTACVCLCLCLGAGCTIGPRSLPADRFNYSEAVCESFKQQMLLNIVRLRYGDAPVFVEVDKIVSTYSLESTLGSEFNPTDISDSLDLSGEVVFEERPTISYEVLAGADFSAALFAPIRLSTLWFLVESGWNADLLLRALTQSFGHVHNRTLDLANSEPADPLFYRVTTALRGLQKEHAIGVREISDEGQKPQTALFLRRSDLTEDGARQMAFLRETFAIPADATELIVQYEHDERPNVVSIRTRSLIQVLIDVAADVAVPPRDLERGLAAPGRTGDDAWLRVRSGSSPPANSFCEVRYRGNWFWIAGDDWQSKVTFSFLLMVFRIKAGEKGEAGPVLTIPTR